MSHRQEPGEALKRFAATALLHRLENIAKEIEGVRRAEDVEYIHRIRVASRRMRSALQHLQSCFDRSVGRPWGKEVRRITERLGEARDLDVQLEAVRDYRDRLPHDADKAGIERLALRLGQRRSRIQPRIERALDRFVGSGVIDDMQEHLTPLAADEAGRHGEAGRYPVGWKLAGKAVVEQLDALHSHDPYLPEPENREELHAMRIEFKRLRYTMELFNPIYDNELKPHIKTVKRGQSLLGDLHDCDVWEEFLETFLAKERQRTEKYFGDLSGFAAIESGIRSFLAERRQNREALRQEFLVYWDKQSKKDTWMELRRFVQDRADSTENVDEAEPSATGGPGG
jgi:CHAD domain-containing protein